MLLPHASAWWEMAPGTKEDRAGLLSVAAFAWPAGNSQATNATAVRGSQHRWPPKLLGLSTNGRLNPSEGFDRAHPYPSTGSIPSAPEAITTDDRRLLLLLNGGLKEGSIASQLGVSVRTVERRITRIMETLSVQTRFQLGMEVSRRGWLSDDG